MRVKKGEREKRDAVLATAAPKLIVDPLSPEPLDGMGLKGLTAMQDNLPVNDHGYSNS